MSGITEPGTVIGYKENGLPIRLIGGGSEFNPEDDSGSSDLPPPPPGVHPGWNPLMEVLPAELHPKVTPVLKEWSRGVDQSFQKYAPYKTLVERGIDPQVLEQGLGFYNTLASNPEQMFYALAEHLGIDLPAIGSEKIETEEEDQDPQAIQDARYRELIDQQQKMAEYLLWQREQTENQTAEQELDNLFRKAHEKYTKEQGYDFDEMWVLSRFESTDSSLDEVIKEYYDWQNALYEQRPRVTPPILLGSGGQNPSIKQDTSKMSIEQLNKYVENQLAAFNQQK